MVPFNRSSDGKWYMNALPLMCRQDGELHPTVLLGAEKRREIGHCG